MSDFAHWMRTIVDVWCGITYLALALGNILYMTGATPSAPAGWKGVTSCINAIAIVAWVFFRPDFA